MDTEIFRDIETLPWDPVRPEIATGVEGRTLVVAPTRVVLTRVHPGGRFGLHRDAYAHLFHFLQGSGIVQVGADRRPVRPGLLVHVAAGVLHGYENPGREEMMLLSLNIPSD